MSQSTYRRRDTRDAQECEHATTQPIKTIPSPYQVHIASKRMNNGLPNPSAERTMDRPS